MKFSLLFTVIVFISHTALANGKLYFEGNTLYYNTDLAADDMNAEINWEDVDIIEEILLENAEITTIQLNSSGGLIAAAQYISDLVESGHRITKEYPDPVLRLSALSRHLMSVISNSLAEIVVCFREVQSLTGSRHHEVMCMHAEYQEIWSKTIDEGVQQNMFREVDKIAVKGLLGMYFYSCLWLKPDGLQSPEDIGDVFSDLVIRSLSRGPGE